MLPIDDFLPKPKDLILKPEKTTKVTLHLNQSSVDFFKRQAKKHRSSYQAMIRNLLSHYTSHHQNL